VFGNAFRHRSWRRPTLAHRLRRIEWRFPWRRVARAPSIAVVAVLAAAIAGWFQPDLRVRNLIATLSDPSSIVTSGRDLVLRPGAAGEAPNLVVLRPSTTGFSAFRLCGGRGQSNCVVDGDTIWYGGVKIRLADIDTPEVFSPKCASEAALGRRATERLLALLNAGPFEVVPIERDADRYGRKLRILERHGRSLGDILIAEGLARRWDGARRSWCG
jgi:endonuclease YncB( thermonuclease family)